jgi:hypothetical protein
VALQTKFCRGELNPQSFLPDAFDRIANRLRKAHEWIGEVMKVDKGFLDLRTEWAMQDLLIDVAAVVAATAADRARNASDPPRVRVLAPLGNLRPLGTRGERRE